MWRRGSHLRECGRLPLKGEVFVDDLSSGDAYPPPRQDLEALLRHSPKDFERNLPFCKRRPQSFAERSKTFSNNLNSSWGRSKNLHNSLLP